MYKKLHGFIRRVKKKLKHSSKKEEEFDQVVYGNNQFKDRDYEVYRRYGKALISVLSPLSVIDIGCANGLLIKYLLSQNIDARGLEGAEAAFRYMPNNIIEKVIKCDLRKDISPLYYSFIRQKFDVVNFTEVAEHVRPVYENQMLLNVRLFVGKYLVVSWSNEWDDYKGTPLQEHFNPRSELYVLHRLKKLGFKCNRFLTNELRNVLTAEKLPEYWSKKVIIFQIG